MAKQFHLTVEGPRRCKVDPSNPNSRGCPLGGMHFDSFGDAMAVYEEQLEKVFDQFHVLVRPPAAERLRRLTYKGMEAVERARVSPETLATVASLKTIATKAREAAAEIRDHYRGMDSFNSPKRILPEHIATRALSSSVLEPQDLEAEANSQEHFHKTADYTDFRKELMGDSFESSKPAVFDPKAATSKIQEAAELREAWKRREQKKSSRLPRGSEPVKAKSSSLRRSLGELGTKLSSTGQRAKETAMLKAIGAQARAQSLSDRATVGISNARTEAAHRLSLITVSAGQITPGDTFDGTTVRRTELTDDGRVKIYYQASEGGPVLATVLDSHRPMRVDRRTRREARSQRNSQRRSSALVKLQSTAVSLRRAGAKQQEAFAALLQRDDRYGAVQKSLRQEQRLSDQRALLANLAAIRKGELSRTKERV